ncbi:MAG: 4-carboxy-4-hydroxy-2-oxoadipate aldolase/oxaloacetate decarboxylase [Bacillota bacterium]
MAVWPTFERPDPAVIEAFKGLSTPTVHEAMGKGGAMSPAIKPLYSGMKVCGPALTVSCHPGDNLPIHYAVTFARPGDVLVVDTGNHADAGPWGDVLTTAAMARCIAGLVIDGSVRDAESIRSMGFPVFARGTCMKGTTKQLPGDINVPILCGGVLVSPGDLVLGDDDGVVVVPKAQLVSVLEAARQREAKEERMRAELRAGKTTVELLGLEEVLRATGMLKEPAPL